MDETNAIESVQLFNILEKNLNNIMKKIEEAAQKRGINKDDVFLLPATKYANQNVLLNLYKMGLRDFGENRVQEALSKKNSLPQDVRWHMIGHLQSNKVPKAVRMFHTIQSVDSLKLAKLIDKFASHYSTKKDIMLEINIGCEDSKFGFKENEIYDIINEVSPLKNIRVIGLMAMTPLTIDKEKSRPYFKKMKEIFDNIFIKQSGCFDLKYLSMGMSQDYNVAVEEGANLVRIGRALFDGILCQK